MLTTQFYGKRLTQAREYRQMTKLAVADLVGVGSSTVSKWESDEAQPRPYHIDTLSQLLGFDRGFFLRYPHSQVELEFWRSKSQATKEARERAKSRLVWLKEITSYVWDFFETPVVNLPQVSAPARFEEVEESDIERMAQEAREQWGLGDRPIENVVRTLERNGIVVSRADLLADKLDALSDFASYPYVFLSTRKSSAVRSRFDAAHELGHILMHRKVTERDLNTPAKFSLIEDQANKFASAFLLPEGAFVRELWTPTLEALREQKEHWGASIACMLVRCFNLGLLNENQYRRLNVQISKKDWRKREPLDDVLEPEKPRLLVQCFENLVSSGAKTPQQILRDLRLPPVEIEELAGLPPGYFSSVEQPSGNLNIISITNHRSAFQPKASPRELFTDTSAKIIEFRPIVSKSSHLPEAG